MSTMRCTAGIVGLLLGAGGCGAGVGTNGMPLPAGGPAPQAVGQPPLPPAGYGTLRQDDVTVSLRADALLLKVTPLDERVTRLTAPDTHQRLSALSEARREAAERAAANPALFLVSFFSYAPNSTFESEDLQLSHQGRLLRPTAVLPISSGFGAQRLQQQETQLAVYVFDYDIDYDQPLTVRYGMRQSDAWTQVIPKLETERAKVRARSP